MAENEGYPHKTTIGSMQQRRRKNELKRLLKHTHPEITMLDKVVDKELAAVLKSEEEEAAAETGYEGEVFSKCLIFENSTTGQKEPLYTSNMAQGTDQTPAASVFLEHSKHDEELIEEAEARIHVHSTRMLFEEQTMKATHSYQHKSQENVCNQPGNQIVNKSIPNIQTESLHKFHKLPSTDQQIEIPDEDFTFSEPESLGDTIKTSLDLFRHNPFIPVNVEKQQSSFQSTEANIPEGEVSHVKTRKHLFETMPFDKIRQQNKDDIETMVENIRETLHFLHSANVLQSKGSIIEVHETMNATKVNFTYTETGPEIMQDTVAEGGAQNFIVHLLPRVNVQPQIKYIKEDRSGALLLMDVNVPVQQKHPDTDFKTANVLQLIEDILTQDNSLRKGVLIQDDVARLSQVSVYSLYHYVDNEDIKSYYPSQQAFVEDEPEIREPTQKDIPQVRSGKIQSAIHCLQESHSEICTTPEKSDITTRGNVKLFKSCIEKGDMEYLKSLQTEVDMVTEEIPLNSSSNNTSDNTADDVEYEPVDIKRLKGLFSSDSVPAKPKPETCNYISWSSIKTEEKSKTADHDTNNKQRQEAKSVFVGSGECVRQAENVEVIGQCDEISSLQVAISQLQKATVEAKSIHDSLLELQDKHKVDQTVLESTEVTALSTDSSTIQIPDSETTTEDEEVVFEGKLQAALQALQRSNLNVARGGFEAAMIYRSSNKVSQSVKAASCETTTQQVGSHSEYNQGVVVQNIDIAGKEIASQKQLVTEKSTKPLRPKPALPPKPEHLKANPNDSQPKVQIQNEEIKLEKEPGQNNGFSSEHAHDHMETQGLVKSESRNTGKNSIDDKQEQKIDQEQPDESHVNFHEARQMFGGKKTTKIAPVKPKRVKIAENKPKEQSVTPSSTNNSEQLNEGEKVTMRGKKACKETEDERRQRLSVHMDEIMRGNIPAAMEIYDNLRKQEELENILIRVEEIEKDTSEVDVKSLKKVFEDVPDWVVSSNTNKNIIQQEKQKEERPKSVKSNSETRSPMAHVFGDLARASEEITHLKEQTLARLLDIEESIKKALLSVSNLKSESDIAGLSSLFKESLGGVQTPAYSGNISTISIGSSRIKAQDSVFNTNENESSEVGSPKQPSPTSSPAFISISAARKSDIPPETTFCSSCRSVPKPEEKFRTTKTLTCHSPSQVKKGDPRHGGKKPCPPKPKREVSMLEVQTDPKGTKTSHACPSTITENYERTDTFGNKFYSTKTSTVLNTEPQKQVSIHPEFQPVSQEKCSACFSPVYSMERVATDKSVFHKRCFCCKHCKKKLSMLNYASLHGKLYCTFHYKQLLRTKGGEEEMEPTPQHQAPGTNN
ncbi:unnamed protein product [Knipowitschia caucasica]